MKNILFSFILVCSFQGLAQIKTSYTYAIKENDTLKLDVYTPLNLIDSDRLPVLLWMHGGGFSGGGRDYPSEEKLAANVAKTQNYIGISISYRLLRKGTATGFGCDCTKEEKLETFKQAVIDYMDAAKYVVDHAEDLQIDVTKIIAGGSSAGAEGVLNAVFLREYFIDNLESYKTVNFAGVFACAGAVVDASYITRDNAIPSVLFHGTKDQLVPFDKAPHHGCKSTKLGYVILDGSNSIARALDHLEASFYLQVFEEAGHEVSAIPFGDLDEIFEFLEATVVHDKFIQRKRMIPKKQ